MLFNCIHVGASRAPHLDFVHKFNAIFVLHSFKIVGHFHDLAGCGTPAKTEVCAHNNESRFKDNNKVIGY